MSEEKLQHIQNIQVKNKYSTCTAKNVHNIFSIDTSEYNIMIMFGI